MKRIAIAALTLLCACADEEKVKDVKTLFRPSTERLEKQTFVVQAEKIEILQGRYGSIWAVPPRAFVDSAGKAVAGEFEIELIEAVRWRDLIVGGLQTRTAVGDSLLSTGGMFRLRAVQNGAELILKDGKGILAYLPKDFAEGAPMNLYYSDTTTVAGTPLWRFAAKEGADFRKCKPKSPDDPCRNCKKLLRQIAKIKPQKPPKSPDDWFGGRYAYDGDSLYFYSSGKKTGLFSRKDIEKCRELMADDAQAQKLFTRVDIIRKQQTSGTSYYVFQVNRMGWHNLDVLVNEERGEYSGVVANADGKPVSIELWDKTRRIKIGVQTDEQGRFKFSYLPGAKPTLFAYSENRYVLSPVELSAPQLPPLNLTPVEEKDFEATLEKILSF